MRNKATTTTDPVELERRLMAREAVQNAEVKDDSWPPTRWTLLRKMAVALSLALIVAYLALWAQNVQETGGPDGYIRGTTERGPVDFVATLTGALVIMDGNGRDLYGLERQTNAQNRIFDGYRPAVGPENMLPYNHLPFEAIFIAPFMNLPYPIVFAIWTLICGIAIGMALGLLDGALPVGRSVGWVLSMAACAYLPLIRGLMLGQNSALVLFGLCGVYVALKRGESGWAGIALVLVALKPQILPIILLLLVLQRHWKTLAVFAASMAALSILAMPLLGIDWPIKYAQLLVGVAGWGNTGAIDPSIMHNWRGFLTNLLGEPLPGLVSPLFIVLSLATAVALAYTWQRTRSRKTDLTAENRADDNGTGYGSFRMPAFDLLWALTGLAAMLTSLHLNPHDLTLLIFPAWIIGAYATSGFWEKRLSRAFIVLLWIGWAMAPFTLTNVQGIVIPSVLLLALMCGLLVWYLTERKSSESRTGLAPT